MYSECSKYFVCLLSSQASWFFWGKRSMKRTLFNDYSYSNRNFTGDFNFCFVNWVNFSEILVGKLS